MTYELKEMIACSPLSLRERVRVRGRLVPLSTLDPQLSTNQ